MAIADDTARVRNPFGEMDVPEPFDAAVQEFAASATLDGADNDTNAPSWGTLGASGRFETLAGNWSSRWNGGADPTIPGDTVGDWKQGLAEVRLAGERVYLLFRWDQGARRGLIDARRDGERLTGKYINLTNPSITRPWIGLIVSNQRIDGRWTNGRLDFRR